MAGILGNTRRPDITFYRSGRIDVTSRIAKLLGLQNGDVIDIDNRCGEFLLFVKIRNSEVVGAHEARCYASKKNSRNYRVHSKRLCNAILAECGAMGKVQLASGSPLDFSPYGVAVPIITRYNLSSL